MIKRLFILIFLCMTSVNYTFFNRISKISYSNKFSCSSDIFLKGNVIQFQNYSIPEEEVTLKKTTRTQKFSDLINILSIALISILSLLSLSLYKNNIIRTKSNHVLKEKNKELYLAKERAEKASKARSEFLSTVSHELRTPLHAINGITYLLLQENPKPEQLHYLQSLKYSGDYLADFINDILEINKIDSEKVELESVAVNLLYILNNIHNSFTELVVKNNNEFFLQIDPAIPINLLGDPIKVSQIFLNIINNSLKFTKNGEIVVKANLAQRIQNVAIVDFEIKDTGMGIPEDKLPTIFDSFTQGSVEINRKFGGSGLGLTIVKKLIELLGGQVHLESKIGQGTRFYFQLKFKIGTENKDFAEVNSEIVNTFNNYKNVKILLVEDNKISQMVTKKMLEKKNFLCDIMDNGEEAIEAVKNTKYSLVLMDVHLPGINGTTATKKIREFNKKIPIIALTAISLNENRQVLMSYGMNDVITKPFAPDNFYSIIAKYLIV